MADANWLRKTPPAAEFDEDPFAELTRIMGFDPRVPFRGARPAEAQQQPAAPQAAAQDFDLSIDLEQELMGALEPEAEDVSPQQPATGGLQPVRPAAMPAAEPQQPARAAHDDYPDEIDEPSLDEEAYGALEPQQDAQPAGWTEVDESVFADYLAEPHGELAGAPSRDEAADMTQPVHDAADEPLADDDLSLDAYYDAADDEAGGSAQGHGFHDHGASAPAEVRQSFQPESDPMSYQAPQAGFEPEAPEPEEVELEDAAPAAHEADHGALLAAELDEALSADLEDDLAYGDDWLSERQAEFVAQEPETESAPDEYYAAHAAPPYAAPQSSDPFASEFDEALAEVDMDFTAAEPQASEARWTAPHAADADPAGGFEPAPSHAAVEDRSDGEAAPADDGWTFAADDADTDDLGQPVYPWRGQGAADEVVDDGDANGRDLEPRDALYGEEEPSAGDEAAAIEQSEIDDAIAELAAMVRSYDGPLPSASQAADAAGEDVDQPAQAGGFVDIDTIEVPESAVALADDLDIPDVDYADDAIPSFDDLDAELAAAFGEPAVETVQPAQPAYATQPAYAAQPEFDLDGGYDHGGADIGGYGTAALAATAAAGAFGAYQATAQRGADDVRFARQDDDGDFGREDFEVDTDAGDDDLAAANVAHDLHRPSPRRGFVVASVVGGIAVLGAIGAFAFSGGDAIGSGEPALVKADTDPVKVRPENPGGTEVANRDSGVFDRAAGEKPGQPQQAELVSTAEEPVDVAARFPEAASEPIDESADIEALAEEPGKTEDRIEPAEQQVAAAEEDTLAVPPRKVRTMIVKPDGTLVPREEETAEQPATVGSTTAAGSLTDPAISAPEAGDDFAAADAAAPAEVPAAGEATASMAPADGNAAPAETAAAQPDVPAAAQSDAPAAAANDAAPAAGSMPDSVPVAPSRPADQPLDIVGEVKPDQVASLDPQAAAAPAGSWSMQIASQPSEAAAQKTYQDLSRKYAGVLGGRSASIVKAEIAGKGTFWRVRVPAGSRNEAIELCESYKAAGGNCFVSK